MKIPKIFPMILILMVLSVSGCYTLLSHPGEEDGLISRSIDSDCVRCHPDYHNNYGYSQYYTPSYWSRYDRWGQYYAVPWWWDYYWYTDNDYYYDNGDPNSPRSTAGGKAVRPGSRYEGSDESAPIVKPMTETGNTTSSGSTAGSGSTSGGTSSSTKSSSGTTKTKNTNDSNERKSTRSGRWKSK